MDWEGNANRIGLRKTEVLTSACASRFHSQVSRSPLKVCLHGDSDSIFPAFLRSACEMDSFIGGCYFTHWSWEILLHLPLELRSQENDRTTGLPVSAARPLSKCCEPTGEWGLNGIYRLKLENLNSWTSLMNKPVSTFLFNFIVRLSKDRSRYLWRGKEWILLMRQNLKFICIPLSL